MAPPGTALVIPELHLFRQRRGGLAESAVRAPLAVAHLGSRGSGRRHAHLAHEEHVRGNLLDEGPKLIAVGVDSRQQRVCVPYDDGPRLFGRHILLRRLLAFVAGRAARTRKELRDAHRVALSRAQRESAFASSGSASGARNLGGSRGENKRPFSGHFTPFSIPHTILYIYSPALRSTDLNSLAGGPRAWLTQSCRASSLSPRRAPGRPSAVWSRRL